MLIENGIGPHPHPLGPFLGTGGTGKNGTGEIDIIFSHPHEYQHEEFLNAITR